MSTEPITIDELCELPCAECGERADHGHDFVLQGRCHPGAGTHVTFEKSRRMFRIVCAQCRKHVVSITTRQTIQ